MALPKRVQRLIEVLLGVRGRSRAELRRLVFQRMSGGSGEIPGREAALNRFLAKLEGQPWNISNDDLLRLRHSGYSEDAIFELTAAAAVGAGVRRLESGLRAVAAAGAEVTKFDAQGRSANAGRAGAKEIADAT